RQDPAGRIRPDTGRRPAQITQFGCEIDDRDIGTYQADARDRHGERTALEESSEDFTVAIFECLMAVEDRSANIGKTPILGEALRERDCVANIPRPHLLLNNRSDL